MLKENIFWCSQMYCTHYISGCHFRDLFGLPSNLLLYFFANNLVVKFLTYWKRNGVSQYPVATILKNNFDVVLQKLSHVQLFDNYCKSFSNHRYFGVYQFFQKCLIIQDSELVKQITVKDFDHFTDHSAFGKEYEPLWDRNLFALKGNEWKNMRAILDTAYTSKKMKIMFNLIQECCLNFVNHYQKQTKSQLRSGVELKDAYTRFATDVIATSTFGYKCDSLQNPTNDFYVNSKLIFPKYNTIEIVRRFLHVNSPKLGSLFGSRVYPKSGTNYFNNLIAANIQEREETKVVRSDIVQTLMEVKEKNGKIKLENIDIAAQVLLFFFAGIETITSALCCVSYELAAHPDVQQRLQMEIDQVMENCQETVTYSDFQEIKYLNMVVLESMRKWPTLYTERMCSKPYVIQPKVNGEVPVYLNKGDIILVPIRDLNRNPNVYPNPDQFDPERFSDENKAKINSYSYLPFGVGPRTCIAKRLALMEIKLLLFHILSKFDIVIVDKTIDPKEFRNSVGFIIFVSECWLALRPRTNVR